MMPTAQAVAAKGVSPSTIQMPNSPAPTKPPTLHIACSPDISRRPEAFSTRIAWIFAETSSRPINAPKTSSPGTARAIEDTAQSPRSISANKLPTTQSTRRQPKRAAATPAKGIVNSEPKPMQSSSSPRTSSSTAKRAFSSGTKGAQDAVPKPPIKNTARVAHCWRAPGISPFSLSLS